MRRWKLFTLSCALLALHSCATSNALKTTAVSERNIDNLARLNLGMSESQVVSIMRDPYDSETLQFSEDKYDVLFYVTNPTVLSQTRMVSFNLTPLIFRNKILIGTGYGYYNWLREKILESKKIKAPPEALQNATSFNHMPEFFSMSCMKKQEGEDNSSSSKELADPPPPSTPKKKDVEINEEDEEMIQDEGDQNFNFW